MPKSLREELGLSMDQVRAGLALLERPRIVTRRGQEVTLAPQTVREGDRIFTAGLYNAERKIAQHIRRLQSARLPELVLPADAFGERVPDASQRAAVEAACRSAVIVMTGGPGVGKTTVAKAILAAYEAAGLVCALCAPTGKAAIRMREQTGREASTIHSTIGLIPGKAPRHDDGAPEYSPSGVWLRGGPIDTQAVVLDETSMVDVVVMSYLLAAIPTGARLLIVGDVDQLPSIQPGRTLFDLITSQAIPTVRLTKIHRQASESRIPYVARDINQGRVPADLHQRGTDFTHLEQPTPESAADRIVQCVSEGIPAQKGIPAAQVQVLVGQYAGPCGVEALNGRLQATLNPPVGGSPDLSVGRGYKVRQGDRVIHTSNNYDINVMNGEMGTVVAADPNGLDVRDHLNAHWSGKTSNKGEDSEDDFGDGEDEFGGLDTVIEDGEERLAWESPRILVVDFGDRRVAYTKAEAMELELGYAVTVHKSQGSQFKAVVVGLHCNNPWMLTRALLYTAITRAEVFCLTVGTEQLIAKAARNTRGTERRTVLQERLAETPVSVASNSLSSLTFPQEDR